MDLDLEALAPLLGEGLNAREDILQELGNRREGVVHRLGIALLGQ